MQLGQTARTPSISRLLGRGGMRTIPRTFADFRRALLRPAAAGGGGAAPAVVDPPRCHKPRAGVFHLEGRAGADQARTAGSVLCHCIMQLLVAADALRSAPLADLLPACSRPPAPPCSPAATHSPPMAWRTSTRAAAKSSRRQLQSSAAATPQPWQPPACLGEAPSRPPACLLMAMLWPLCRIHGTYWCGLPWPLPPPSAGPARPPGQRLAAPALPPLAARSTRRCCCCSSSRAPTASI